jgi:hypothetical protein
MRPRPPASSAIDGVVPAPAGGTPRGHRVGVGWRPDHGKTVYQPHEARLDGVGRVVWELMWA